MERQAAGYGEMQVDAAVWQRSGADDSAPEKIKEKPKGYIIDKSASILLSYQMDKGVLSYL